MHKRLVAVLLLILVFFAVAQTGTEQNKPALLRSFSATEEKFNKADRLAYAANDDSAKTVAYENLYRQALTEYSSTIPRLFEARLDSAYITASIHRGIIYHYFDSLDAAMDNYLAAIRLKDQRNNLQDSLIFQPLLFAGSLFYNNDQYDSSLLYLKRAEQVKAKYSQRLAEEHRLYNLLGVLYYEKGELNQSLNYVQKALALHTASSGYDKLLAVNYQMNIASVLIKLEKYTAAENLLQSIENKDAYAAEIQHKLGFIKLKEKDYRAALRLLNTVNYVAGGKKQIDLFVNKCMAYTALKETDSARLYLLNAKAENLKLNGNKKTITNATLLKTEALLLRSAGDERQALQSCQQAIINFCHEFTDSTVYANPANFSGAFAYIDLFNTLILKGDLLNQVYQQKKNIDDLEAALAAYKTAFQLAAYVERTYESDEARLFLNSIKYNNHSKPIELALQLYELTNKNKYIEEAYFFDQQNKASILALNVRESEFTSRSEETNKHMQDVVNIKSAITRLSLKASSTTDSTALNDAYAAIQDKEIELGKLQQKIKEDPAWQQLYLREQVPSVSSMQKKTDNSTAIISWHLSETEIIAIIITRRRLDYVRLPLDSNLLADIDQFKQSLHTTGAGSRYNGTDVSRRIYEYLWKPLRTSLTSIERLIIIPDDELHYLPFEALQDEAGNYLVQRYSIQYLWSTALFQHAKKYNTKTGTLSVAPFAGNGYADSIGTRFSKLPASAEEVGDLPGLVLLNDKATREEFLTLANQYPIIHLATHASVNNENPDRSFVAFYPGKADYKLYAKEIYNLRLDSAQLLILSACETGSGQLVRGEGLMSLSRAFTYAGCSDIITSLWKAEDKTTSYITRKIHFYLGKGMSRDKALRQAKLDFLDDKTIDQRLKTPNYWAHLVYIGNYETSSHTSNWPWIAAAIIIIALFYYWLMKRSAGVPPGDKEKKK